MELPDGQRFAHEAQLANQSIQDFEERTEAYRSAGIEPVWWLGHAADTESNWSWVHGNCSYFGKVSIETTVYRIIDKHFDREESLFGVSNGTDLTEITDGEEGFPF